MRICFLASRRGTNLASVIKHIELGILKGCEVTLLVTNRPGCGAEKVAEESGIEVLQMPHLGLTVAEYEERLVKELDARGIDLVVSAGWDWMIGRRMREVYRWRLMAIHPSLHPSFIKPLSLAEEIHHDVLRSGVKVTGCTVYYVDRNVDTGPIILQRPVPVLESDYRLYRGDPDAAVKRLSERVLLHEHLLLPKAIQLHTDGLVRVVELGGRSIALMDADEEWEKRWNERQQKYIERIRSRVGEREVITVWP
jgi:phosphoribosylglycinamide formyltransferase-1